MLHLFIPGEPVPKGSMRAFPVKKGDKYGTVISHTPKSKLWEAKIRKALEGWTEHIDGPVLIILQFFLTKPKTVKRELPGVKPDIDKLERAVLDGVKSVIGDDGHVTDVLKSKRYATLENPAGVHVWFSPVSKDKADRISEYVLALLKDL